MNAFHQYLSKHLADRLKQRRIVVWYDPRGEFQPYIAELQGGKSPADCVVEEMAINDVHAHLCTYDGSFFEVRVVWVQFEDPTGRLSKPRLLLATEAGLRPEAIIKAYARRWPVEPMFNVFRHSWGWIDVWQQSRQVLARWVQILSVSYALVQLLVVYGGPMVSTFASLTPWRVQQPLTAGRVRLGLQRIFGQVNVRAWWDPKSRKFRPPDETTSTEPATSLAKVA